MAKTLGPQSVLPVEKPILASLFRIYGSLLLLGGLTAGIVAFIAWNSGSRSSAPLMAAAATFVSVGTLALIAFGVAQIIDYIARIAVAAEQTAMRAIGEDGAVPVVTPLRTAAPVAAPRTTAVEESAELAPKAHCPHCNMPFRVAKLRRGRNVCPSCCQEFEFE